ncbi:solute carrier family 52, riboflavin transporter, member 3-A-like [Athalia rosae]|uniref:solute carrier family 52, riboflavin transporter, member 3-A-like n=1 Tax=Athalia rosae TaxID=37344 RepID=UPI0020335D78|nr:solute carrier family 52, riboflavin transporter, member 3-A-like [Athalia rosae]
MTFAQRFRDRRIVVDALALTFGIGTWLGVNGIFVQLPLLINNAPEGWELPAFISVISQLGNLGPLIFALYTKYASRSRDHLIIYGLLGAGTAGMFCLVFLHQEATYIFGADRSSALLGFMFVAAVVGCTSSVLFMPYMRNYREIYLVSYLVGEGLSGFLPSVLALIQGVNGNPVCVNATEPDSASPFVPYYQDPEFSTAVFFGILGALLSLSFLAFVGLNYLPVSRSERVKPPGSTETLPTDPDALPTYKNTNSGWTMPKQTYIYLLLMMGVVCALGNTGLSSIQSYSCLPYGNVAYHLAVTLGTMALPLAMCIGFFVKNIKVWMLSILTLGIIVLASFVIYLGLMSPSPPLQHTIGGKIMVVVVWVVVNGLVGFVKLAITTLFRPDPGRGLFWTGVASQIGSMSGAIIMFSLVKFTNIFVSYSSCDHYDPTEGTAAT